MRILRTLFTLLALCAATISYAQLDAGLQLNGIQANPTIGVEYAISNQFGIELQVGTAINDFDITITSGNSTSSTSWQRSGILANVFAKYYFKKDNPAISGFYGAGYLRFRNINFSEPTFENPLNNVNSEYSNTRLGIGVALGYKALIAERFIIDVTGGGGFAPVSDNSLLTEFDGESNFLDDLDNIDIFVRLGVGYRIIK